MTAPVVGEILEGGVETELDRVTAHFVSESITVFNKMFLEMNEARLRC
jgi:hypothetical protein